MKSKEELNGLKEEVETLSSKLTELTDEELESVNGGTLGTLLFRPGINDFKENNPVFNSKRNHAFLDGLLVKGNNKDNLQKQNFPDPAEENKKIII